MLGRSITTTELINIQSMFALGYGYKDLIREFKKAFNVDLPKQQAKQFMTNRSWSEVLKWLTGEDIDTSDRDKIPAIEHKHYVLLQQMLAINQQDELERKRDIETFLSHEYYIPEDVKYFNFPVYGEIITYKYKEPFIKCFLLDDKTGKVNKIEDVPVSKDLPEFLLSIIRKINYTKIASKLDYSNIIAKDTYANYITYDEAARQHLTNIFDSELFVKYHFTFKT